MLNKKKPPPQILDLNGEYIDLKTHVAFLQSDPLKDLKTVFDVDWPSLQGTLYQGWRFPRRKISRLPLTRFLTTRSGRKRSVLYLKSWPFHWKGKIVNAFLIFSSPARMD